MDRSRTVEVCECRVDPVSKVWPCNKLAWSGAECESCLRVAATVLRLREGDPDRMSLLRVRRACDATLEVDMVVSVDADGGWSRSRVESRIGGQTLVIGVT